MRASKVAAAITAVIIVSFSQRRCGRRPPSATDELLKHQLLPVFGDRLLSVITSAAAEAFVAEAARSGRLAPKTVNHTLALLKQSLTGGDGLGITRRLARHESAQTPATEAPPAALDAGRDPAVPAERARGVAAGVARGRLHGPSPGEIQAMAWREQNWPDFTSNWIHHDIVRSPLEGAGRAETGSV
jgi:hypothetical protein